MKRFMLFPVSLLLVLNLWGCSTNDNTDTKNDNTTTDTKENTTDNTTTDNTSTDTTNENTNNGTLTGQSKVEVADDVADEITKMDEVESANVLVTNENAYVGVMLKEGTTESKALEDKISETVRGTHSEFKNVYISMNPDFAKQLTDYGQRIREGEPVEGFFKEFSDAIKRVFPNAK